MNTKFAFALCLWGSAWAQTPTFMPVSNEAALARGIFLPALGATPALGTQLALDLTNEYLSITEGSERITLDGETLRLTLSHTRPLTHGWTWSMRLPVLSSGGGFLDSFIENWHDTFSLPNGGRALAPQDRYLYRVVRGGETVLLDERGSTGLGDAQITAARQFDSGLSLHAGLQLPTGNADRLRGGRAALAAWAHQPLLGDGPWQAYVSGGASVQNPRGVLRNEQRVAVGFAGAGLGWQTTTRLSLQAQLAAHTPLYQDTGLSALTRPGVQLALGGHYALTPSLTLALGVQEDAVTRSSPDFSIHTSLHWR